MQLSRLFLGYNDAALEIENPDFASYFYNHEHLVERALKPTNWLILGRKGTGKSLLGGYLVEHTRSRHGLAELSSYKDFHLHKLADFRTDDVSPNQFIPIWKWLLLIELARLVSVSQELYYDNDHARLNKFFQINFGSQPIDKHHILEVTKGKKIQGEFGMKGFKVGGELEQSVKSKTGQYLDYLNDMEETLLRLLQKSRLQYLLVVDDLDHRFNRQQEYHDLITGVVYATDGLNKKFRSVKSQAKIVILLRPDIFNWLNDPAINKAKIDAGVQIDWGTDERFSSPLFDLIVRKVRASLRDHPIAKMRRYDILKKLFPSQKVGKLSFPKYFLDRTLMRPRDVVTFLNYAKTECPKESAFSISVLRNVQGKYSEYLYGEFRNELYGHLPTDQIDLGFRLLKSFSRTQFNFDDIEKFYLNELKGDQAVDLRHIFRVLFDFSVIGNSYYDMERRRVAQSWAYLDRALSLSDIDFNLTIRVHFGLHSFLRLTH